MEQGKKVINVGNDWLRVIACFSSPDDLDYEELGLKKPEYSVKDHDTLYIRKSHIYGFNRNSQKGYLTIRLIHGESWAVFANEEEFLEAIK